MYIDFSLTIKMLFFSYGQYPVQAEEYRPNNVGSEKMPVDQFSFQWLTVINYTNTCTVAYIS